MMCGGGQKLQKISFFNASIFHSVLLAWHAAYELKYMKPRVT